MERIDFYQLTASTEDARLHFICRLCEKASASMPVYLHTGSEQSAQSLDSLMWEFTPDSFLPHAIVGVMDDEEEVPVLIGFLPEHMDGIEKGRTLLVNLAPEVPAGFGEFSRVAEVIIDDESAKQVSRKHWQEYRESGTEPQLHKI